MGLERLSKASIQFLMAAKFDFCWGGNPPIMWFTVWLGLNYLFGAQQSNYLTLYSESMRKWKRWCWMTYQHLQNYQCNHSWKNRVACLSSKKNIGICQCLYTFLSLLKGVLNRFFQGLNKNGTQGAICHRAISWLANFELPNCFTVCLGNDPCWECFSVGRLFMVQYRCKELTCIFSKTVQCMWWDVHDV